MHRLGYTRYVAQGGDQGRAAAAAAGQAPPPVSLLVGYTTAPLDPDVATRSEP